MISCMMLFSDSDVKQLVESPRPEKLLYECMHLQIFHELKGPIFPPRDMRRAFPAVQEIIDRIEASRRSQHNS